MAEASLFDEMGGEVVLGMVIERFMEAVFSDSMIGFMFAHADRERIKAKEYELAASVLGAEVVYTGRPLGQVHAQHPISTGHFSRRLALLQRTLTEFQVPDRVARYWLEHNEQLRAVVVSSDDSACGPVSQQPGLKGQQ